MNYLDVRILFYFFVLSMFAVFGVMSSRLKKSLTIRPIYARLITALFSGSLAMALLKLLEIRFGIYLPLEIKGGVSSLVGFIFDYYRVDQIFSAFKYCIQNYKITITKK